MPVFLAFVRDHNALEIGEIMLVTGVAQLLMAPIAVALEQRVDARLLTAAGFGLFGLGLGLSALQTTADRFRVDVLAAGHSQASPLCFACCRRRDLALGHLDASRVPDASGLFNLMRNLGGAIGLAMIDTVIYTRSPVLGAAIHGQVAGRRYRDRQICRHTARMFLQRAQPVRLMALSGDVAAVCRKGRAGSGHQRSLDDDRRVDGRRLALCPFRQEVAASRTGALGVVKTSRLTIPHLRRR